MHVSTKFTVALHLLCATEYFNKTEKVTSAFLAGSIGTNAVTVRNIMLQLQHAGIISVKRGSGGIALTRPLAQITFLDIYQAVETGSEGTLFNFHENPNPQCPVGRNLHRALDSQLSEVQKDFERDLAGRTVASVYDKVVDAIKDQNPAA